METGGRIIMTSKVKLPPSLWVVTMEYSFETILEIHLGLPWLPLTTKNCLGQKFAVWEVGARITAKRRFFIQNVLTFIINFLNRMPTQSSVQTEPSTLIQDENMSVSVLNAHKDITVNLKD